MWPIRLLKNNAIVDLKEEEISSSIIALSENHRSENRAIAFAFILYDFGNPQISKVLNDIDYFKALNQISGNLLSIFYIDYPKNTFGKDLSRVTNYEQRSLHKIHGEGKSAVLPILKNYLQPEDLSKIPSILFFQVEDDMISDYFLIELVEEKIEESFLELRDYILEAVDRLEIINKENYCNFKIIFESLKQGVESAKFRKVMFRNVKKFPVTLLINWIATEALQLF